ncbi:glycine cleavage system aminomethyltransferase GcvT [Salinicoccus cyprini]|uniref:Aminomethyltransferase n=1 Tax=Salinicoccus cyprini TaxID=2493691 RepID=A0A558AYZ7_9STAP|nr:glycine cleavage system aminomethyltransferase GcvT [Salinicoccus cyprini]TVT29476.1 glycine cleavage system aminomethyltransferase GcvT [Salinicoccus cyprini]
MMSELKKTPLYDYYQEAGAKVIDFSGWALPVQFSSIKEEHTAVREAAGIFDVSHMGELLVEGSEAEAFLNYALTNNVSKLTETRAQYTMLCNEQGGVIDDLVIYRLGENKYLLVVNAGNTDKDFEWLKSISGFDATITNISAEYGQIAVQGPKAREIVQSHVDEDISEMKMFRFKQNMIIAGCNVILSQSGYTGEDGFEIYCDAEDTEKLWKLFTDSGVVQCGLGARDTLRLEAALPLHGQDLTEDITPVEGNMGFAVKVDKEDFIGKTVLRDQKENGAPRKLAGFELLGRGIARTNYEVTDSEGNTVGHVTSGTQSPLTKRSIGLALIDSDFHELDKAFNVRIRNKDVEAKFVKTPFHKN